EIKKPLNRLAGKISDEDMQAMNYDVTVKKKDPYNVAKNYLEAHNLIDK
ncbi:glycine betaine ABC transporter substrate-binding protein, partial [Staphylococcus xylosus]